MGHTNSLGDDFHNKHIYLKGISPEFLYARFAWTIFRFLSSFLNAHITRALLFRLPDGQEMAKQVTFEEIRAQSLSPRKRQMTNSDGGQHTTKRLCLDDRFGRTSRQGTPARTLLTYTGTSLPSVSSPENLEQSDLDTKTWIRSRRPSDPHYTVVTITRPKKSLERGCRESRSLGVHMCVTSVGVWNTARIGIRMWKMFFLIRNDFCIFDIHISNKQNNMAN